MPRVVADSDDESDIIVISPPKAIERVDRTLNNSPPNTWERDPLENTDFEQFLSPTQRLSACDDAEEHHGDLDCSPIAVLTNSSHERFLSNLSPPDQTSTRDRNAPAARKPDMGGKSDKKRSRTALEQDGSKEKGDNSRKRSKLEKTAATRGATGLATDYHSLVQDAGSFETMAASGGADGANFDPSKTITPGDDDTSPLDLSLSLPVDANSTASSRDRTQSYHNTLLESPHLPPAMQQSHSFNGGGMLHGTTTHSSMGGYQSFNIDPQTLGSGIDSYNPFGTLSQVSLENGANEEDTRGIEQIFKKNNTSRQNARISDGTEQPMELEHIPEMLTSPEKSSAQQPVNPSPEYSPISTRADPVGDIDSISIDQHATKVKAAPKKRGRKPKARSDSVSVVSKDEFDKVQVEQHPSRAVRAGSVTSVSNVSDASGPISNSRRNKKVKQTEVPTAAEQTKKMPSSELGLDNKEVIGLSPERYQPRPSKRRGRTGSLTSATLDDTTQQSVDLTSVSAAEPVEEILQADVDVQPVPAKGKKGRKAKAKKGKKAAVTEPIEIEQEVKEEVQTHAQTDEKVEESLKSPQVSINIPTLVKAEDNEDPVSFTLEPKKRGRKRKIAEDQVRPVLGEKDVNVPAKLNVEDMELGIVIDKEEEDGGGASGISKDDQENKSGSGSSKENGLSAPFNLKASTTPEPSATASTPLSWNIKARIGLSKRNRIPSLLQKINRNKEAPKVMERKEKLNKRQLEEKEQERIAREEAEAEGREYVPLDIMRDKHGRLIEWDF